VTEGFNQGSHVNLFQLTKLQQEELHDGNEEQELVLLRRVPLSSP
jgi:hypothetical protein